MQLALRPLLCLVLGIFDLALGGTALFSPQTYADLFHPNLADPQIDLIARTGCLWLFFAAVELFAFYKKTPLWFFAVGLLRLLDVPADLVYGTLAAGASPLSRAAIFLAPVFNLVSGI
ncbi:MAG TPA: hypothetical protein VLJ37_02015, partial [bacterium]|nr:hypothetical protein [bacterium]